MRASLFWFSDEQWTKIEALVPTNRPGPKAKDNRRILSGIMHVLKVGCRWQDCPPEYGPSTTVYNRFNRWSGRGIWQQIFETAAGSPEPPEDVALDSTHAKAHRCAGGGEGGAAEQAIGITRGGRNSKLHALVDKLCRPWVIILTPGNTADCTVGPQCVSLVAGIKKLLGDKAYDSDSFRKSLKEDGITPVIPGRANRTKPIRHDKEAYKGRNVIERCFCRLKDFRRIATRYDKLARNYFSSACLVAAVVYWL
jgi:transposase